ncbi:MAG TPA: hypothetical protein PLX90_08660, partial [Anaerolineales bacterium]|nr:hypothetical protein [Anaerolineales bacterium]
MKQKFLFVFLLFALVLSACGTGQSASTPAVVRIGWGGGPDTLNPGMAILAVEYTIFELVYDSMY